MLALEARELLYRCIDEQGVLGYVQNLDAAIDSANGFGYTPLHYAGLFGDKRTVAQEVWLLLRGVAEWVCRGVAEWLLRSVLLTACCRTWP